MSDAEHPLWPHAGRGERRFDVLGIGQNALDRLCSVRSPVVPGEKRSLPSFEERPGGQVATAVLTCARLGLRCAYAGRVGDDSAAEAVLAPLRAAGVHLDGVEVIPETPTQTAVILVDPDDGERTILWHRAPALHLTPAAAAGAGVESARLLLLDAADPEAATAAAQCAGRAGIPVILDADRYDAALDPLLALVDFPLVSRQFAETFSETGCVRETLRGLLRAGARLAVVTLGDRGAIAATGEEVIEIPAAPVSAVDTTGAGDVFHGAFAWAVLDGRAARPALRIAAAAAALNCRAAGAQGGIADRAALESFLQSWREDGDRS